MNITLPRAVIEQALTQMLKSHTCPLLPDDLDASITALRTALEQPQSVQVSPLDFTHAVLGKEDAVGRPIFWAEWPNREKA